MTEAEPNLPFERLGEYDVLAPISEGGMGSVWLGRRTAQPAELVALKVIRQEYGRSQEFVAMLADEAGIASRLSHPHILSVRALGHEGTRHFLVMELLRGHTLLELWNAAHAQGKPLPLEVVAWIGARVADALHYAHELRDGRGTALHVVHRDVNPANIFLTRDGVPKLIDFGLAKARDRIASTAIGVVKGKLAYLAPEQAQGQPADRRSDIFALGVTLWELTLDRRLFQDDSDVQTVRRVREAQVPAPTTLRADYPPQLAAALVRALARDPNDRWQDAAQLRDALDAYVGSTGQRVDTSKVRALSTAIVGDKQPAAWERLADEAKADQERTRIWDERKEVARPEAGPPRALPALPALRGPWTRARLPPRLVIIGGACALSAALLAALIARSTRGEAPGGSMEQRVARIEGLLGLADAGTIAMGATSTPTGAGAAVSADDDRAGACALAKIAGYQAWQDALARAKISAAPAEAACTEFWSDTKKQACYRTTMAEIRATQAARDAAIAGGAPAREAVKNVKDNPKNEAIARARAASQAAFAACEEDGG